VRRGEKQTDTKSLLGAAGPTGPLLHLERGKGLFSKATSSEGLWIQSPAAKQSKSEAKNRGD